MAFCIGFHSIYAICALADIGGQMADHAAQDVADSFIVLDNQNIHFQHLGDEQRANKPRFFSVTPSLDIRHRRHSSA